MQDELGNYLLLRVRLGPEAASVGTLSPSIPGCDLFGNRITAGVFREVKMRSEGALVPSDLVLIKGEVWMQTYTEGRQCGNGGRRQPSATRRRVFTRCRICKLNLGLPGLQSWEKYISDVNRPPSLLYSVIAA